MANSASELPDVDPPIGLSGPEALQWSLRREAARKHLIPFCKFTMPDFQASLHHHIIAEVLEEVERGTKDRVIITMPPRHGKSELASRRFPAYFMGRNPKSQLISASYNSEFASEFGAEVRDIVQSEEYRACFNTELRPDAKAKQRWKTKQGGKYVSAGIGTSVTGRGADVLIIDDPLKDHEEADSETRRELIYNWYSSVAYTRLQPGGRILLIQTRWHEDDLAGRLLNLSKYKPGADQFELIELAALDPDRLAKSFFVMEHNLPIFDPDDPVASLASLDAMEDTDPSDGSKGRKAITRYFPSAALWPGGSGAINPATGAVDAADKVWFPEAALERIKANMVGRHWSALFQQKPTPEEGDFFKRKYFKYWVPADAHEDLLKGNYTVLPKAANMRYYTTSDYATEEGKGDWTVHCLWGVDSEWRIYLIDMWRKQADTLEWCTAAIDMWKKYKPMAAFEESGQIIKSVGPFLNKMMQLRQCFTLRIQYASHKKKDVRARSIQGRMSHGYVYLPLGAEWTDDVTTELLHFPHGTTDDIVDNFSLIGRAVDKLSRGDKPDSLSGGASAEEEEMQSALASVTMDDLWAQQAADRDRLDEDGYLGL